MILTLLTQRLLINQTAFPSCELSLRNGCPARVYISKPFPLAPHVALWIVLLKRMSVEATESQFSGWGFSEAGKVCSRSPSPLTTGLKGPGYKSSPVDRSQMPSMHCFISNKYIWIRFKVLYFLESIYYSS